MDKLENYRKIIKDILNDYAQIPPAYGDIVRQTAFDEQRDHYQLINTGWKKKGGCTAVLFMLTFDQMEKFGFNTMERKRVLLIN